MYGFVTGDWLFPLQFFNLSTKRINKISRFSANANGNDEAIALHISGNNLAPLCKANGALSERYKAKDLLYALMYVLQILVSDTLLIP